MSTPGHFFAIANFCQKIYRYIMTTMNISLPDSLKSFVDQQVTSGGYSTSSEYVRELIRKDKDRRYLRKMLIEGADSAATVPVDGAWFEALRDRVRLHPAG